MSDTPMAQEQRDTTRSVLAVLCAGLLAITTLLAPAPPAEAATQWVSPIGKYHHKPKSWLCSTFNICKTVSHYYCGNPNIAYTRPQPCVYLHKDRY